MKIISGDIMIGIYIIKNKINNKCYIGKSINIENRLQYGHLKLLNNNKHYNKYLQDSWNKYGNINFEFNIVEECKEKELNQKEKYWINYYKSNDREHGYNLTIGGDGLNNPSREVRKKISIYQTGKCLSYETKKKISNALSGNNNPFYGKKHSIETKEKISLSRKGQLLSEQSIKKRTESRKDFKFSEESKLKMSNSAKNKKINKLRMGKKDKKDRPSIQFTNNEIQDILLLRSRKYSIGYIADKYNVSVTPIKRIIKTYS